MLIVEHFMRAREPSGVDVTALVGLKKRRNENARTLHLVVKDLYFYQTNKTLNELPMVQICKP